MTAGPDMEVTPNWASSDYTEKEGPHASFTQDQLQLSYKGPVIMF